MLIEMGYLNVLIYVAYWNGLKEKNLKGYTRKYESFSPKSWEIVFRFIHYQSDNVSIFLAS